MSYRDRLSPWCIMQLLPKMQRKVVARFRKRNDAEAHLRALRQLTPTLQYKIVFDPRELPNTAGEDFSYHFGLQNADRDTVSVIHLPNLQFKWASEYLGDWSYSH